MLLLLARFYMASILVDWRLRSSHSSDSSSKVGNSSCSEFLILMGILKLEWRDL